MLDIPQGAEEREKRKTRHPCFFVNCNCSFSFLFSLFLFQLYLTWKWLSSCVSLGVCGPCYIKRTRKAHVPLGFTRPINRFLDAKWELGTFMNVASRVLLCNKKEHLEFTTQRTNRQNTRDTYILDSHGWKVRLRDLFYFSFFSFFFSFFLSFLYIILSFSISLILPWHLHHLCNASHPIALCFREKTYGHVMNDRRRFPKLTFD